MMLVLILKEYIFQALNKVFYMVTIIMMINLLLFNIKIHIVIFMADNLTLFLIFSNQSKIIHFPYIK